MMKVIDNVEASRPKRYNKNKKKAWRKKTQITDVEERLEEQRREERYGGPLEEREDEELMFLDLGDDCKGKELQPVTFAVDTRPGLLVGFKPRSRKITAKPLRSHMLLQGLQGAKTMHKAKSTQDKQNAALKQKQSKMEVHAKKKNLVLREEKKVRQMKLKDKPTVAKISSQIVLDLSNDAWTNSNPLVARCKENGVEGDFIDQIVDFHSKITGERAFNVPKCRYEKTSILPAVTVAEAGQSYNPSFVDHQTLLEKAVKQEVKRRKMHRTHIRATTKMFPTIDKAPTEQSWLNEMSEGLPKAGSDDDEEASEDENEEPEVEVTVSGKRTTERKTLKQRKKAIKRKFSERKKKVAKEKRIRENNVYKIKAYKKEIKVCDKMLKNRQSARRAYQEQRKSKPLRLGKVKYEAEDIAVSVGSELRGSLRLAKPAVSLLGERFKNFQRRNLIESRLRAKRKKPLQKKVMKRDHKEALAKIEEMAWGSLK